MLIFIYLLFAIGFTNGTYTDKTIDDEWPDFNDNLVIRGLASVIIGLIWPLFIGKLCSYYFIKNTK